MDPCTHVQRSRCTAVTLLAWPYAQTRSRSCSQLQSPHPQRPATSMAGYFQQMPPQTANAIEQKATLGHSELPARRSTYCASASPTFSRAAGRTSATVAARFGRRPEFSRVLPRSVKVATKLDGRPLDYSLLPSPLVSPSSVLSLVSFRLSLAASIACAFPFTFHPPLFSPPLFSTTGCADTSQATQHAFHHRPLHSRLRPLRLRTPSPFRRPTRRRSLGRTCRRLEATRSR